MLTCSVVIRISQFLNKCYLLWKYARTTTFSKGSIYFSTVRHGPGIRGISLTMLLCNAGGELVNISR